MTKVLAASTGLWDGTAWPVRVFDPPTVFSGLAVVQLAVRIDP